ILLPRAEVARSVLPDALRGRGADVVEVAAYRTVPDGAEAESVRRRLAAGEIDVVTFTSSSTAKNFVDLAGTDLGGARVASIGPITSATARELGLTVDVEAEEYTISGLVAAVRKLCEGESR
ncbi:MAG TPA: uroporphyrinogen-III synthase, partial [Longimicrobiaceae bacterium]|nr:uroporphyrinogen-III synthase [Longimicrobiaceae bacterium]